MTDLYDDVIDPYTKIEGGALSSGIPVEGYVDYSYEVRKI